MRRVLFISVIFASLLSIQAFASDAKQVDADEAFDIKGMIMHHLKDSHEWHILDYKNLMEAKKLFLFLYQ